MKKGFTLIELLVVIAIIGILAAFAVPQYMKSLETTKAEDAAAVASMVGTTNRMYALDHQGVWASGQITTACGSACCTGDPGPPACAAPPSSACNLVACKYLAAADYSNKPYIVWAGNGGANGTCGTLPGGGRWSACTRRGAGALNAYRNWGYHVSDGGAVTIAPGSNSPPPTP